MNIFAVNADPRKAAEDLCDQHVVKMTLESAQILSTALEDSVTTGLEDSAATGLYKPTHRNHPCVAWTKASKGNFDWLLTHARALSAEYAFRFGRIHASAAVIERAAGFDFRPRLRRRTPFTQCMPECFRQHDPVAAYRAYYSVEKRSFARWRRGRPPPSWWVL